MTRDGSVNEKNRVEPGVLYLVATPIGNMADITERARKVLSEVDFIAAEDTRNSGRMLAALGISKPMLSYFEHNKAERGEEIARRLKNGESCALVTDAGTPAISDPGEDVAALCEREGVKVTSVPGACAAVTALTLSGLPTRSFVFEGFLPLQNAEAETVLARLEREERTSVLYEAPHRLRRTLERLETAIGADRRLSLCRELTKLNEEVIRTTVGGAVEYYAVNEPRGEYVLVVGGRGANDVNGEDVFWKDMSVPEHVAFYQNSGMQKMDAMKAAAKDRGVPKNEIYKQMLQ